MVRTSDDPRAANRTLPKAFRQITILACAVTLLWAVNALDGPAAMLAQSTARGASAVKSERSQAVRLRRQECLNTLATLIGQSIEVLAIHARESAPYTEIVLWRSDIHNPGVIDCDELAVVSHCRLFKSITQYETGARNQVSGARDQLFSDTESASDSCHLTPETSSVPPRPGAAAGPGALGGQGLRLPHASVAANMMLDRALASQPGFCDRWRGSPQVLPQLLASDLSDMLIEPCGLDGDELSVLRLSLRWAEDSTDGAPGGEMSVVVKRIPSRDQGSGIRDRERDDL